MASGKKPLPRPCAPSTLRRVMTSENVRPKVQVHLFRRDPATGEPRYLVLRRPESKGGIWQPVTGNVDPGEELDLCARREVREETGLDQLQDCRAVHRFEFQKGEQRFRETVFAAECPAGDVVLSSEHTECRWVPYEEARRLIHFDSNREALDIVHRSVTGSPTSQENVSR